jgi:hypothetical protein
MLQITELSNMSSKMEGRIDRTLMYSYIIMLLISFPVMAVLMVIMKLYGITSKPARCIDPFPDCSCGTMFLVIADHVEDGCTRAFSIAIFSASTSMSYYHSDQ